MLPKPDRFKREIRKAKDDRFTAATIMTRTRWKRSCLSKGIFELFQRHLIDVK